MQWYIYFKYTTHSWVIRDWLAQNLNDRSKNIVVPVELQESEDHLETNVWLKYQMLVVDKETPKRFELFAVTQKFLDVEVPASDARLVFFERTEEFEEHLGEGRIYEWRSDAGVFCNGKTSARLRSSIACVVQPCIIRMIAARKKFSSKPWQTTSGWALSTLRRCPAPLPGNPSMINSGAKRSRAVNGWWTLVRAASYRMQAVMLPSTWKSFHGSLQHRRR